MSRLALGTVQFGQAYGIANVHGQVSREFVKSILFEASACGINMLDTAIAYGESEACLGEIGVESFNIVTKLPMMIDCQDNITDWVREQVQRSILRLGVSQLYGVLLHRPSQLLEDNGAKLFQALLDLRESGLVKKIGFSIYGPKELDSLVPVYRPDLVQAPLNLMDRRLQHSGWLDRLKQMDIEIHTRSAFLQGLLLMPRSSVPLKFAPWAELFSAWHNWLEFHETDAVQACLAYPMSCPEVDRVVVGVDRLKQFQEIIFASQNEFNLVAPDLTCDDEGLINPAYWSSL